jgi:hypothetical protein
MRYKATIGTLLILFALCLSAAAQPQAVTGKVIGFGAEEWFLRRLHGRGLQWRASPLEETDTAYVIRLGNPDAEYLEKDCVGAVEIVKRELGNLPG